MNKRGSVCCILDDFLQASHYCWKNEKEVLLTVVGDNGLEYRLYNIEDKTYQMIKPFRVDGHPSYISSNVFLTDTYPNRCSMQELFLGNDYKKELLAKVYHSPFRIGEKRCDLHPHYYKNMIHIDNIKGKQRSQIVFILNENFLNNMAGVYDG